MRLIGFEFKVRLNVCSIPTYEYRYTFGILLVYFLWTVNGNHKKSTSYELGRRRVYQDRILFQILSESDSMLLYVN